MSDVDTADRSLALLIGQKDVLERIVAGDPLDVVLDSLVRLVEQSSDDRVIGSILLLDDDGVHLRHGAAPNLPASYVAAIDGVALGPRVGSCGTAAYRRAQVIVADIATDPLWEDFRDVALAAGLRACWSTPIMAANGELLGTFAMYYPQPRTPAAGDLTLIDVLVRTAAVAIVRCRDDDERERVLADERAARGALERAHRELNFVLDVTTRVASSFDYHDPLGLLARLAVPMLGDVCLIDVVERGHIRRAAAAAHRPEHDVLTADLARFAPVPGSAHPVVRVLDTGEPQYAAEVSEEFLRATCRDDEHYRAVRSLGFESYVSVPLEARGRVFGALTLVSAGSGRRYEQHDLAVVQDLARRAALAVDNTRLYQAARDAEQRLSLVARTGAALTSSLDLDTVVERLGGLLVGEVGDVCEIHFRRGDGRWWRRTFLEGDHGTFARADALPILVERAMAAKTALTIRGGDADTLTTAFAGLDASTGTHESGIVVPLAARGGTIGAIALAVTAGETGARVEPDIVEVLAGRAALAIDNARLFEEERTAAEILQRSLLPRRLPVIDGMRTAARYQPAGPRSEVGGDWYDVLVHPDGRVGVVMGDVMGRGIPAASVMGRLRNALQALALEQHEPAESLGLLDRLLQADDDIPLATAFYAVIDPVERTMTAANAGHCPPLLLVDGDASYLDDAQHPPLGVAPGVSFGEVVRTLPDGAVLVLYTDGLIERRDRSLTEGLAVLARAAASAGTTDPDALCDHLLASLTGDDTEVDDTAILVVRFSA